MKIHKFQLIGDTCEFRDVCPKNTKYIELYIHHYFIMGKIIYLKVILKISFYFLSLNFVEED